MTVQKMVTYPNSFELMLGTRKDPMFGAVILVGMGGVAAEVLHDRALDLPPLNERLARRHARIVQVVAAACRAIADAPAINIDALIEIIMRFSYLVADYPEIKEMDINPLLAGGRLRGAGRPGGDRPQSLVGRPPPPFSHLAIRPYPEEYTRERTRLKDGT